MKTNSKTRSLQLAVRADRFVDSYIPVHWCLDEQDRQGIVYVDVAASYGEDRPVIAELCALNYLMSGLRPIYGSSIAPPTSKTTVSSGAIKKLFRKDTQKETLIPFGRSLFFSFADVGLHVSKNTKWTDVLPVVEEMRIVAAHSHWESANVFCLDREVALTRHAIERFQERICSKGLRPTLVSLRRLLASPDTRPISISEYRERAALARYGKAATILMHQASKTVFVVTPEGDDLVLVSVYLDEIIRQKQAVMIGNRVELRWL